MMNDFIMHALRQCPLFMGMSEVSIELALGSINYQIVSLEKRDVYALAGMPCRFADIVVKGSLVCRMASLSGKQVEVSRLQAGDIIAPAFIFAKDNTIPVSVETSTCFSRIK